MRVGGRQPCLAPEVRVGKAWRVDCCLGVTPRGRGGGRVSPGLLSLVSEIQVWRHGECEPASPALGGLGVRVTITLPQSPAPLSPILPEPEPVLCRGWCVCQSPRYDGEGNTRTDSTRGRRPVRVTRYRGHSDNGDNTVTADRWR